MTISSLSGLPGVAEPTAKTVGKKELDRADFMNLFITQLQYQDPMEPMDTYQMSTQLAQFSSMEATLKMSSNMEELLAYQTSQNNLQLLDLLGNNVQALGNMVAVNEGVASTTEFTLADAADTCVVEIYDPANNLVRTIDLGAVTAGSYDLEWDGMNNAGKAVEDAAYVYKIKAMDGTGNMIDVDYRITGKVTGIEYESGQAMLTVDKFIGISVNEVLAVK